MEKAYKLRSAFILFLSSQDFEIIEPDEVIFGNPKWNRHGYQHMYDAYRRGFLDGEEAAASWGSV